MTTTNSNGDIQAFPPVVLGTTLYDLLRAEQIHGEEALESLCLLKPNSDPQYGTSVPLSNKYIIHSAQVDSEEDLAPLQLENCSHLLMFFAGPLNVIFLAAEGGDDTASLSRESVDRNARRSFGVIQQTQRPNIYTYANIEDFVANHDGSKIRWGFAMDFAERLPYLFHPELVYELNSKRWLAECDLKSANDRILDCEIDCKHHQHRTTDHKQRWYHNQSCETCTAGVRDEVQRVVGILKTRKLPFVLKLTQSLSSVGTIIVKSEEERSDAMEQISQYLADYLPRITKQNVHLNTTALILSDFLPGETMALNFFVRRDGTSIFLGACHQLATGDSGRQATAITYADQEKLEKKFRDMLARIGKVLKDEGYYVKLTRSKGACGADIMETENGTQNVIDLNVRTPLSLVLYLLGDHFQQRGLGMSLVYECVMLSISRNELEKRFVKELHEARIVLLGGTKLGGKDRYGYGMVLAGEDRDAIDELSDRILKFEL
ncbi:hypothetical protein LTR64_007931 [Lithohypha guttulata]|nr:hypothetical protein LTR51_008201 [Lithohypha guttulata]